MNRIKASYVIDFNRHHHFEWYLKEVPNESVLRPRDNRKLYETTDILFYAMLVGDLSPDIKSVDVCKRVLPVAFRIEFLLRDHGGILYEPVTREVAVSTGTLRLLRRITPDTVRREFIKQFYGFRADMRSMIRRLVGFAPLDSPATGLGRYREPLELSEPPSYPHIQFGGLLLVDYENIHEQAFAEMNSKLRWAVHTHDDPLLDRIDTLPLVGKNLFSGSRLDDFDAICPVDGHVTLTRTRCITPSWTWPRRFGRDYTAYICPHCLAYFGNEIHRMS